MRTSRVVHVPMHAQLTHATILPEGGQGLFVCAVAHAGVSWRMLERWPMSQDANQ